MVFNPHKDDVAGHRYTDYNPADYEASRPEDITDDSLVDPDSGVKRGLKNRHLSMMALAGIIGPGLLVGAGGALQNGGPASLLIGFGVIGMSLTSRRKRNRLSQGSGQFLCIFILTILICRYHRIRHHAVAR
jgi:hypothetical protein